MKQLKETLQEHIGSNQVIETGDFRMKNISLDDNTTIDLDISFVQKTDKLKYSTDRCLQERLNTIKSMDSKKYSLILANILTAKKVLKEAEAYKPNRGQTPQGGLGGVGIENWILQNGGSFYDAATEFVQNAEGKTFEEFIRDYQIWDFGQNHFALKTDSYQYDDFVSKNMSSDGFDKMVDILKIYLNNLQISNESEINMQISNESEINMQSTVNQFEKSSDVSQGKTR